MVIATAGAQRIARRFEDLAGSKLQVSQEKLSEDLATARAKEEKLREKIADMEDARPELHEKCELMKSHLDVVALVEVDGASAKQGAGPKCL